MKECTDPRITVMVVLLGLLLTRHEPSVLGGIGGSCYCGSVNSRVKGETMRLIISPKYGIAITAFLLSQELTNVMNRWVF